MYHVSTKILSLFHQKIIF